MGLALTLGAIAAAGTSYARVYGNCQEPRTPFCLSQYGAFESDYQYKDCKRDIENYIDELNQWADCVSGKAEDSRQESIKKFNCRVDGKSTCF